MALVTIILVQEMPKSLEIPHTIIFTKKQKLKKLIPNRATPPQYTKVFSNLLMYFIGAFDIIFHHLAEIKS